MADQPNVIVFFLDNYGWVSSAAPAARPRRTPRIGGHRMSAHKLANDLFNASLATMRAVSRPKAKPAAKTAPPRPAERVSAETTAGTAT